MMWISTLVILVLISSFFVSGSVASKSLRSMESEAVRIWDNLFPSSHKFQRKGRVPSVGMHVSYNRLAKENILHTVVIAIQRRNFDEMVRLVHDVSNPYSSKYGQHLTRDEIAAKTSKFDSLNHVKSYLSKHPQLRIVKESRYGDYLTVEAPVSVMNKLFNTQLYHVTVKHEFLNEKQQSFIRAKEYSLPWALVDHVREVFNIVQIPPAVQKHQFLHRSEKLNAMKKNKFNKNSVGLDAFPDQVTPDLLNSYYKIGNNTGNHLIEQSVYETLNQSASPSDLTIFQETFSIPVQSLSQVINGHVYNGACTGANGIDDCGEANLDVQYLMGVAQNVPTVYYYWGGEDFMLDWITQVTEMANPPEVISISYGAYEINYDASYLAAFDQEAIILALQGTTIFVSSGDDGVAGYAVRGRPLFCDYYPQFPASSPMVTTVGATNGPQSNRTEVVCQSNENGALITTGGGFSDIYPQPSWQKSLVEYYFENVMGSDKQPYAGYTSTGRGYPDVALLGHAYVIVTGGEFINVDGTSASAPVMAGFAALVNSHRKAKGLSTLGWLNPALYATYDAYIHDITSGNNNCTASWTCCKQGFYAAPGWDPTTGLGSVMFDKFFDTFASLQSLNNTDFDDFTGQSNGSADDDNTALLSVGAVIAIIVVVIVVCLAISITVAYFCVSKQSASPMHLQENPMYPAVSQQPPVVTIQVR